jgi:hypothetical protein
MRTVVPFDGLFLRDGGEDSCMRDYLWVEKRERLKSWCWLMVNTNLLTQVLT